MLVSLLIITLITFEILLNKEVATAPIPSLFDRITTRVNYIPPNQWLDELID